MSEVKVNKISPRSGTTVTLGDSGDTFTIPAGATINNQGTATNFGATGSASWNTTVKTNSDSGFTATAGEGYFLNTTAGTISVNLPAGTAGAVVAFKDYAGTWDSNAVTLVQNGSDKIGGSTVNATLSTEGSAVTLIFIDSTQGWLVTDDGLQSSASTAQYVTATGGTITTVDTNFKVHTFTGPGTFAVSCAGNASGSNEISYMVVAGGGSGGVSAPGDGGGGAGAGGFREGKTPQCTYTQSPIACTSGSNNGLSVTATSYPVTVGGGGTATGSGNPPGSGSPSTFAGTTTITSAGGGGGAQGNCGSYKVGVAGGSGGGGGNGSTAYGGAGNTPPVSPAQGFAGGDGLEVNYPPGGNYFGGGGGGATAVGTDADGPGSGPGGAGATTSINGSATAFAGGGGGACVSPVRGGATATGGAGGGANASTSGTGNNGTVNTGGGASGGFSGNNGGTGGSGIVIIRYKFQN